MTEFYIEYPKDRRKKSLFCKEYGLNAYYSGKHWTKRKNDADLWHDNVRSVLALQKGLKLYGEPVIISFYFDDGLDCSNHSAMCKMIEDSIKGLIIVDDSKKYVVGIEQYMWDGGKIKVLIRTVGERKEANV